MLRIENIDVFYGFFRVIRDLSFSMDEGEILLLTGVNGSGKTTVIKTISAILRPRRGIITYNGRLLNYLSPRHVIESGLSHVPEGRLLFPEMSVEENLATGSLHGRAKRRRRNTLAYVYALFPVLGSKRRDHAGTLSGGEQQMLAIGRGLMSLPRLMMLDEPSLGLAPVTNGVVFDMIKEINSEDIGILVAEQNPYRALAVADRTCIMENGRIVLKGTDPGLLRDGMVKEIYMGI